MFFIFVFFIACGGSPISNSEAEAIKVHVFLMANLTEERTTALLTQVQDEFQSRNINIVYVAIDDLPLFDQIATDLDAFAAQEVTKKFRSWLIANGYTDKRVIYYAIFPPMGDEEYVGGSSCGLCSYRTSFSCAHSNAKNDRAAGNIEEFNKIAMAHELAHVIGADHVLAPASIMHPSALVFAGKNVGFTDYSISQINNCLTFRRKVLRQRIHRLCASAKNKIRCARRVRSGFKL